MINLWLDKTEEKLQKIPNIDPQKIRMDLDKQIIVVRSNMDNFYKNFKQYFHL